ncbi:hypothetical protein [Caminibacter pacificus]|jgi:hypothetical protein
MSLISQVTLIYQNAHVPSAVLSDYAAREIVSREFQKIINEEKERKVEEVKPVEEVEEILPEDDSKSEVEEEIKRHIDIKV